jgi:hypothetical protein
VVVGVLAALAAAQLGCAHPPSWPHEGVVIVDVLQPSHRPSRCTGTIVSSTGSTKIVLTARHCVVDADGKARPASFEVTYSRSGPDGERWSTVHAKVIRTGQDGEQVGAITAGPWVWQEKDWALLRADTPDPIEAVPLLDGIPRR